MNGHNCGRRWDWGVRRGNVGLVLVVLIAIAIIMFLMFRAGGGGIAGQASSARKQAKATVQEINTQQMSLLIGMYRSNNNGKLPKTVADLDDNSGIFKDPWGGPITFTFQETGAGGRGKTGGAGGQTKVIYHSNGPDGEAGTADDVTKTDTLPPL